MKVILNYNDLYFTRMRDSFTRWWKLWKSRVFYTKDSMQIIASTFELEPVFELVICDVLQKSCALRVFNNILALLLLPKMCIRIKPKMLTGFWCTKLKMWRFCVIIFFHGSYQIGDDLCAAIMAVRRVARPVFWRGKLQFC